MSSISDIVSSDYDDRTIRPTHKLLSQTTGSSISTRSDASSSSKASIVADRKLGVFFPRVDSATPIEKYSEASLQQIANLLRLSHRQEWGAVPRIYTVLRNIGQLQLIDDFINEGFTDICRFGLEHSFSETISLQNNCFTG